MAVLELLPFSLVELQRREALKPHDCESSLADMALPQRPSGLDLDLNALLFKNLGHRQTRAADVPRGRRQTPAQQLPQHQVR